jgi:hypothetical protein
MATNSQTNGSDMHRAKAKVVYELFSKGECPGVKMQQVDTSGAPGKWISFKVSSNQTTKAILENLDHITLSYFVELVTENHERSRQIAKSNIAHADNRATKQAALAWLTENVPKQKKRNLSEAARKIIAKNIVHRDYVTVRKWATEWAKSNP